jgi:putative SOS response-associated peptidase YedK
MPVIIDPDGFDRWLTGEPDSAAELIRGAPVDLLTAYPVSTLVNNARNESPDCVKPLDGQPG